MFTPLECRLRAAECQKVAEQAPNPGMRATLEDMARIWNRLAVDVEDAERARRPRFVVVQQSSPGSMSPKLAAAAPIAGGPRLL
jgi:hypothetical protein